MAKYAHLALLIPLLVVWIIPPMAEGEEGEPPWPSHQLAQSGTWHLDPPGDPEIRFVFANGHCTEKHKEGGLWVEWDKYLSNCTHPDYLYAEHIDDETGEIGPHMWKFVRDPATDKWKAYRYEGGPPATPVYKGTLKR
jgi:hypothetical protein